MIRVTNLINVSLSYSLEDRTSIHLNPKDSVVISDANVTDGLRSAAALNYIELLPVETEKKKAKK